MKCENKTDLLEEMYVMGGGETYFREKLGFSKMDKA